MSNDKYIESDSPVLSSKEFELFREWLYVVAGIKLADAKSQLVAGRLNKRLKVKGLTTFTAYFDFIQQKKNPEALSERQIALDLLTTNETYFFREPAHFDFVKNHLLPHWTDRTIHCWSAASSTGQEAYSLAMLLEQHHKGEWKITGTDLSSRVVQVARLGVYPIEQSTKIDPQYLRSCCLKGVDENEGTFRIASFIRKRTDFLHANLQEMQTNIGKFDLILLRNVMIYFDPIAKKRVIDNILTCLKPGGYLFIGHAESINGLSSRLRMLQPAIYHMEC